tara:strand:- start:136 stop:999 length:864 start_codon:yes stop_codon:yes gene_type:complete
MLSTMNKRGEVNQQINEVSYNTVTLLSGVTNFTHSDSSDDPNVLTDGVIENYYYDNSSSFYTTNNTNPQFITITLENPKVVTSVVLYRSQMRSRKEISNRYDNFTLQLLDENDNLLEEITGITKTSDIQHTSVSQPPELYIEGIGKLTTTFTNGTTAHKVKLINDDYIVLSEIEIFFSESVPSTLTSTSGSWHDNGYFYEYSASQSSSTRVYYKMMTSETNNVNSYDIYYDVHFGWTMNDPGQQSSNPPIGLGLGTAVSVSVVNGSLVFINPFANTTEAPIIDPAPV